MSQKKSYWLTRCQGIVLKRWLCSILFQGYINYEDSCPTNGINQMNVRPYESSRSRSTYVAGTRVAYDTIVCSN